MKVLTSVLILPFLLLLSSCSSPEIRYVDRTVYLQPIVPAFEKTEYPGVELRVWGDYKVYKMQCEAQLDRCNLDKKTTLDSLETK